MITRLLFSFAVLLGLASAQSFNVSSPLVESFTVSPGGEVQGELVLTNTTDQPQALRLAQGDYQFVAGGTRFEAPGTMQRSNARWLTLSRLEVALPPKGRVTVPYTLRVPTGQLEGSFWSAIFVEPAQAEVVATGGQVGVGVTQRLRYAVQILANIGDSGEPKLVFQNPRLLKDGKTRILQVEVRNQGNRFVRPDGRVELYTEEGRLTRSVEADRVVILPEAVVLLRIVLGEAAPGRYQAALILDDGGRFVFGARYRFTAGE